METEVIIKIGGCSDREESIQNKAEEALSSYVKENFQEILTADKRDIQYSIHIFLKEEISRLCRAEKQYDVQLLSYMIVAADWEKMKFVSIQWGKGMILFETADRKRMLSCPCYRESLKESYERIKKNDISQIYIRKGGLEGITKFILSENNILEGGIQKTIEVKKRAVLY